MNHPEHTCHLNDGEQSCTCYDEGFEAGRKEMFEELKGNSTLSALPKKLPN